MSGEVHPVSTASRARAQRFERVERMTEEQRACAFDFLVNGDERGLHAKRCVWPKYGLPACSREYDPGPAPEDTKLYEGTTLGALWGLNPQPEGVVATMNAARTGWNIKPRRAT